MTRTWLSIVCRALVLAVVLLASVQAKADEDASSYPSRPIHIIVPFPPAGPNDILARLIADQLAANWNAAVVVDNRPGGGTIIGTQIAARSEPDGYTLLMVSQSTATNISLKKSLPYDTLKDFTPMVHLADSRTSSSSIPMYRCTTLPTSLRSARSSLARSATEPEASARRPTLLAVCCAFRLAST